MIFRKRSRHDKDRHLQMVTGKSMPFAYVEAYKSLRTNLNFVASANDARSFVITSAVPQESKSNVAVNLALTLTANGKRVVVVDCDLRKPIVHKYLKLGHNTKGVTNILTGTASIQDCIHLLKNEDTVNGELYVLPAGVVPPNPSELLAQDRMYQLVQFLKEQFDYVILDAPPVSVVTDAVVLGRMVDGALLVVRSSYAPRESILLAKKKLTDVNIRIFGVILTRYKTKWTRKSTGYSYSYGYDYNK